MIEKKYRVLKRWLVS